MKQNKKKWHDCFLSAECNCPQSPTDPRRPMSRLECLTKNSISFSCGKVLWLHGLDSTTLKISEGKKITIIWRKKIKIQKVTRGDTDQTLEEVASLLKRAACIHFPSEWNSGFFNRLKPYCATFEINGEGFLKQNVWTVSARLSSDLTVTYCCFVSRLRTD